MLEHTKLVQKDEQDAERTDETDAEQEDAEESATDGSPVGELVAQGLPRHHPSHEQAGEQTTDRQENLSGDEVEKVEERLAEERQSVVCPQGKRTKSPNHCARSSDEDGRPPARDVHLLLQEGGAHLMQRNERGEGSHGEQQVEHDGHDIAHDRHGCKGLVEHVGQGDEDQRSPRVGIDADGEGCGENHQSGEDGHHAIDDADLNRRLQQIGLAGEIGGIGANAPHGDAERIERLSKGAEQHVAIYLGEVGIEQEVDAFRRPREHARGDDDDQQEDEKRGHHHLRHPLYAVAHPPDDDEMGDEKENHRPYNGFERMRRESGEILLHIIGIAAERPHYGAIDILQAPPRDDSVVARDEIAGDHTQVSDVFPCAAIREPMVGPGGIGGTVAPDDELAHHAGDAEHQHAENIDEDECRPAVLASHVGEAPHIAQADRRPCRGEHDTKFTAEIGPFCCL